MIEEINGIENRKAMSNPMKLEPDSLEKLINLQPDRSKRQIVKNKRRYSSCKFYRVKG